MGTSPAQVAGAAIVVDRPPGDKARPACFLRSFPRKSQILVMAGLVPAIHVLLTMTKKDVDARNKCGHDEDFSSSVPTFTGRARRTEKTIQLSAGMV
jgi:hypothetical protein